MRVAFKRTADEQLEKLPPNIRERILSKIYFYASQPEPLSFAKRLFGYNAYRFRIGNDYRAICEVDAGTLYVLLIVKREGAYRDL
ncbi:type II toxin-antitoxin system RelE/ParE family toxin [Candidatus Kaiserbacteria bacterium]|nr:type II toxin-antitoxin system RelE/ParE family toxin [Candidatus Kaiserbacteria bacterium]